MRIAQISPIWAATPPIRGYGGIEWTVHYLARTLRAQGHEVVVFATGDSSVAAEVRSLYPEPLTTFDDCDELRHVAWACREIDRDGFDVVHNHTTGLGVVQVAMLETPSLTTLQLPFGKNPTPLAILHRTMSRCHPYVAVSDGHRASAPDIAWRSFVYNGIDAADFPFSDRDDKEDYLLFLGRVHPVKAPEVAVRAALATGHRLKIAGPVLGAPEGYFEEVIAPHVDGDQIEYVGEVGFKEKTELFRHARALLHPVQMEEPFGFVLSEALVCGTPVIAFRRGIVPEVVIDGEVGYVVEDVDGMIEAVGKLDEIEPRACRERIASQFSPERMAEGYVELYQKLLAG